MHKLRIVSMAKNRPFVNSLIGLAVLAAFMIPGRASAQMSGPQPQRLIERIGPNLWIAGLKSVNIDRLAAPQSAGRQRRENWCWAASVQMMLNLAGVAVTQEQVVERIYGGDLDRPGTPPQIINALSGWAFTFNGKPAVLWPSQLVDSRDLIEDLSLGWPLIAGLKNQDGSGHAEVITAVTYSAGQDGTPVFQSVILRDPWPFNPSRVEMQWNEFASRAAFIVRNRVTYPQGL